MPKKHKPMGTIFCIFKSNGETKDEHVLGFC